MENETELSHSVSERRGKDGKFFAMGRSNYESKDGKKRASGHEGGCLGFIFPRRGNLGVEKGEVKEPLKVPWLLTP